MDTKFHEWRTNVRAFQRKHKLPIDSNERLFIIWHRMDDVYQLLYLKHVSYFLKHLPHPSFVPADTISMYRPNADLPP